jgi:hypothetical protein
VSLDPPVSLPNSGGDQERRECKKEGVKADQVERNRNEFQNLNHSMELINYLLVC